MIRVDGKAYTWMGDTGSAANETVRQTSLSYTSTKSIFTIDVAGKVGMNITFLSPVTPNDFRRQSLVFSYMNVQVYSTDGSSHEVQLYADISAGGTASFGKSPLTDTKLQNGPLAAAKPTLPGSTAPLALQRLPVWHIIVSESSSKRNTAR